MESYTVTINFRGFGQRELVHEDIMAVSVADGLVGISDNSGEKWVYPIDTIKNYHLKLEER